MKRKYFNRFNWVSFLTAFVILSTQMLVFRIISAKLWNNYAFLVISFTMLGFALSGVILSFCYKFIENPRKYIHIFTHLFVITLLISTFLFYRLSVTMQTFPDRISYVISFLFFISLGCLFVIPFTFGGLILGILLGHKQLPTPKIYCFDLAGSALGALLIVFSISFWGVEKSLLGLCALFLIGINIILPYSTKINRLTMMILLLTVLLLYPVHRDIFKMKHPVGSHLTVVSPEYYEWDPVTRIEVSNIDLSNYRSLGLDLSMLGPNPEFHKHIKKFLTQNNNAGTWAFYYDGNIQSLKGIENTLYFGSYKVTPVPDPNVLVIGVGGGMDILTALYGQASRVTGVEINGAIHNIVKEVYKDYFKHWVDDPRIHLVHDEGRHYLSNTNERYDIIQLTGVDSLSATMASVNTFSENYLYTNEAVKLYYKRLNEDGVINIIRREFPSPPREMLRMLATTVDALREMGIEEPSKHIVMISNTWLTGASLLIKKKPFSPEEIQKLKVWADANPYFSYSTTAELPFNNFRVYQAFLERNNASREQAFINKYPLNIRPTRDDNPFFFRFTEWKHLFIKGFVPVFELNIISLLSLLTVISWIFISLPLQHLLNSGERLPPQYTYMFIFSCLGLGYMFIEIAFMQKLGLFLGHPNYAISVVLFGLLLSTGIGSLFSKNIIQKAKEIRYTTYCLSILILTDCLFVLPNLNFLIGLPVLIKSTLALLLIAPIGLLLGIYFPETITRLKKISPRYVPWGWGINGVFSVLSPIIAIAISVTFGINFLLFCSIPIYLTVGYLLGRVKYS